MLEAALSGRLSADPERRTSTAGKPWMRMNVAVGEGQQTQWVSVSVFADIDALAEQLHKGDLVYAEGRLQLNRWNARDGAERVGLSLTAWKVEPVGQIGHRRPRQPSPRRRAASTLPFQGGGGPSQSRPTADLPDDEIPF